MDKKIEISVIIPMYNAENTITSCIDSVLNQTYKGKMEVIIVNDGSKDNSQAIVEDIIKENSSNIVVQLINKENGGVSSARNKGLALAKGEYIALLDSDDSWYKDKLEKQYNIICDNLEVDFLGSILSYRPWKRYLFRKVGYLTRIELNDLMFKFCFQPSTVIFRKEIIDNVGFFDENQKYAEEGNFFMRIVYAKYGCFLINEKLTYFGINDKRGFGDGGLSGNLKEMQKGEIMNHKYALNNLGVNKHLYYSARSFSFIKYIRRIIIVKLR
jgi:glycosyltransferase involved in cell wall biosynthesis